MRDEIMQALATVLSNNLGNKLSAELATGIATAVNQYWMQLEEAEKAEKTPSQPT